MHQMSLLFPPLSLSLSPTAPRLFKQEEKNSHWTLFFFPLSKTLSSGQPQYSRYYFKHMAKKRPGGIRELFFFPSFFFSKPLTSDVMLRMVSNTWVTPAAVPTRSFSTSGDAFGGLRPDAVNIYTLHGFQFDTRLLFIKRVNQKGVEAGLVHKHIRADLRLEPGKNRALLRHGRQCGSQCSTIEKIPWISKPPLASSVRLRLIPLFRSRRESRLCHILCIFLNDGWKGAPQDVGNLRDLCK